MEGCKAFGAYLVHLGVETSTLTGRYFGAHALNMGMVLLIWEGGGLYVSRVPVVCHSHSGSLVHGDVKKKNLCDSY